MRLSEIKKLASGVYVYNTDELVRYINAEYPRLGSSLFRHGYFDAKGNQDSILYQIEQAIEDNSAGSVNFSIVDIEETETGRLWHVINM